MSRKFIIDTDTASDDAVALIMALRSPNVEVAAITLVAGNVPVDQGLKNALYTAELCGVDVPVYRGAARPLLRELVPAYWFHGEDGMGDRHYPDPKREATPGHAVDVLIDTIKASPGIVLVTLGPLTNVALAVARAPEIVANVSRCVVMGGAANAVGNVTPAAEYNIWVDPEAARIVFHSGLPIEMVGWELCREPAALSPEEMQYVYSLDTDLARFAIDCNKRAIAAIKAQSGEDGLGLPDPVAMAVALDPTICTRSSKHYVDIETRSELTRGATVIDALDVVTDANNRPVWGAVVARGRRVSICWGIDVLRWKSLLYGLLV